MRILIIAGKLTYSNRSTYTIDLVRGLKAQGHSVQVGALGGPLFGSIEECADECYSLKFNYFSYRRILTFLREFKPDLIHATGGSRALESAARISKDLAVPLLHTLHSWLEEDRNEELPAFLRGVIAVNENLRQQLVNEQNIPKGNIRVIPYGVELAPQTSSSIAQPENTKTIPVVGAIGRLEPGRGYDEFLKLARSVCDQYESVHFIIAGDGPDEARLANKVRDLKLTDQLTFVQPGLDRGNIYTIIDVLVLVSDWGGVGLTLLEGMAHDCPVVATGGGEVFSLLGEEEVCVLVPSGNTTLLADEVIRLIQSPSRRADLAQKGRDYVKNNYALETSIAKVIEYYERILSSSGF